MVNKVLIKNLASLAAVAFLGLTSSATGTPLCNSASGLICSYDGVADEILPGGDYLTSEQVNSVAPGSSVLVVQAGNNNQASALIVGSPGSKISQGQFGNGNASFVMIHGGVQNEVNVLQAGNGYRSDIFVIGSQQTTVNNLQAGNLAHPVKQLFVINGKPGTTINMR